MAERFSQNQVKLTMTGGKQYIGIAYGPYEKDGQTFIDIVGNGVAITVAEKDIVKFEEYKNDLIDKLNRL